MLPVVPAMIQKCAPDVKITEWHGLTRHTKVAVGTPPCINKAKAASAKQSAGTYYEFPSQKGTDYVIVLYDGHTVKTIKVKRIEVLTERT